MAENDQQARSRMAQDLRDLAQELEDGDVIDALVVAYRLTPKESTPPTVEGYLLVGVATVETLRDLSAGLVDSFSDKLLQLNRYHRVPET